MSDLVLELYKKNSS